jgi:serine/threonine protein kinase/dienelactone hydrolase
MNGEQWKQIEELYHSARENGPHILDAVTPDIRLEVQRLLAEDSGGKILDGLAMELFEFADPALLAVGTQLGPYRIEGRLGSGGMATVYRATDTRLGRPVAIKIPAERYSERFQREARAISTLNHPHICSLYDVGPNYLVMEFIDGSTLASEISRGALAPDQVVLYGAQIAGALSDAHSHGIVHSDLKPANIMLTPHGVKVLDFGVAQILSESGPVEANLVMGTPAYMAPEQLQGCDPSIRSDLFALGLVLQEMAVGKRPLPGKTAPGTGHAAMPPGLNEIVVGLLEKDPTRRPQSASEVARALTGLAARSSTGFRALLRPVNAIAAIAILGVLGGAAVWLYQRSEQRHWVREQAIPEISRIVSSQPLASFLLMRKAEEILPGDAQLSEIRRSSTRLIAVDSTPAGATVEIQDYVKPGAWFSLGATPLKSALIPNGYFRWRISKPGAGQSLSAPETEDSMHFTLRPQTTAADMDTVPAGQFGSQIDFVGFFSYNLPAFELDRFEVTNRQYQRFVDEGGYQNPKFWLEKFLRSGKELSWQEAMKLFVDATGHPGPSTWKNSRFSPGESDYPVAGVSWYEAAAYAVFSGKSLPTLAQWYKSAPTNSVVYRTRQSNFNRRGPVAVGTFPGVGPYGTYDLNGNVREWQLNGVDGDRRLILGGGWSSQPYQASDPEALPSFNRDTLNGFRCVRNSAPLPPGASDPIVRQVRNFAAIKPASDEIFRTIRDVYAYDHTALNAKPDGVVEDTGDWTKEKVTIDAGYDSERLPLYLLLPKNAKPPYQTVLFVPSIGAGFQPSSKNLVEMQFVDYVIKSGRALVYPVYKGTYERSQGFVVPWSAHDADRIVQQSKEIGRSLDYLETRRDIDRARIGYLGLSSGAAAGVLFTALEERFHAVVLLSGGFFLTPVTPARDQLNFAPRLKKPLLMINGRYDFVFSPERSQEPMFRMVATPAADKRHVLFDTPHDVSQNKEGLSKEVLSWFDKYLGRVG